jgi:integration host factor subunit beta
MAATTRQGGCSRNGPCRPGGTVKSTLWVSAASHLRSLRGLGTSVRMLRSELITRIAAQNPHMYESEVEALVKAIFTRIAEALAEGDRVELRAFGTFSTNELQERAGRNPKTGEAVTVAGKRPVHFKPSKAMRMRLNLDRSGPE